MAAVRNNDQIFKGNTLMVFIEKDGSEMPIGFATSHSLSITLNTSQVSTKDHGDFPATLPQNITWEVTAENLYSDDGEQIYMWAMMNKKPVTVKFAQVSTYDSNGIVDPSGSSSNWTAGTVVASGDALVTSYNINAPAGDNATMTVTFTGTGSLETNVDDELD